MRISALLCLTAIVIGTGCRDSNGPEEAPPFSISTDSATYTRRAGSLTSVEVGFRNNSTSTIWIGSCGEGYSSRPGTSPVIAVYGLQTISYATNPPRVGDVAAMCRAAPIPYGLAPGMGVRVGVILAETGRFAFSAPFSYDASGTYDQRTASPDFTIVVGP